jgi:hypothetical protein
MTWEVMERLAWLATAVAFLWLLHLITLWWKNAPTVYPDHCVDRVIRHGHEECGGPCTNERPLPCERRATEVTA